MKAIIYTLLLFTVSFSSLAIDWGLSNDDENKAVTQDLKDLVERVKQQFSKTNNAEVKSRLEEIVSQVQNTIKENKEERNNFIISCKNDYSTCHNFRRDFSRFLINLETSINIMANTGSTDKSSEFIHFDKIITTIATAPGGLLFPMYKLSQHQVGFLQDGFIKHFDDLPEHLTLARFIMEAATQETKDFSTLSTAPDQTPGYNTKTCQLTNNRRDDVRAASTAISRASLASKLIGKILIGQGSTETHGIEKSIGIHGYGSFTVKANRAKSWGGYIDGTSDALSSVSDYLSNTIYRCETLLALSNNHKNISNKIAEHDEQVQELLNEVIDLLLTPQGKRQSSSGKAFPNK